MAGVSRKLMSECQPPPKLMRSEGSLMISITSGWPAMPVT